MSDNRWNQADKYLNSAVEELSARQLRVSVDQWLKMAEVEALLAIGQELSAIRRQGINPEFDPSID